MESDPIYAIKSWNIAFPAGVLRANAYSDKVALRTVWHVGGLLAGAFSVTIPIEHSD